jgi:hypothetical protein
MIKWALKKTLRNFLEKEKSSMVCQVRGLEQERALFEAQIWIHSKHLKDPTPHTPSLSALSWVHVFIIFKREREREMETVSKCLEGERELL